MENELKCPTCGSYEFYYAGIQTFDNPIRKYLDLWTCNNCHSTISTKIKTEKVADFSLTKTAFES
ncbi:MAG: hypothetical protein SCARUB_03179 [Candidatus Scalindua rubra]|uniref:Uncharacterized protein n=1 Tax=Candidatus Scalindua rubra TaxID=1872076 RepID=A0A1E3X7S1_9BACT|nr:MAG: hypothetical protein SCARUB_03179 [Candidatus Scalindua rubra]